MRMMKAVKTACKLGTLVLLALAASAGCGVAAIDDGPSGGTSLRVPSVLEFPKVSDAMPPRCATLDCHGQQGRNMRLYGFRGMRLDPDATPLEGKTTADEYTQNYWSVVGLEPEMISEVIV